VGGPQGDAASNRVALDERDGASQPVPVSRSEHGPFSFQPAHVFGTPGAAYIVGEDHIAPGSALRIGKVWPLPFADLGTVPVTSYVPFDLPLAPFLQIDTGDGRIQNVVHRNGSLFTTHTVPDPSRSKTVVRWYEINPASTPATRLQEGTISDPNRFYYYPSVAVNLAGDVAIGFSGSSSSPPEYAGAYYTARRAADPPNTMHPVTLLRSGKASYFKTFSGRDNRWGDFSATVVDPADDTTFWTLQEIASTPVVTPAGAILDRWATWWGSFGPPAIDPPTDLAAVQLSSTQFRLTWTNPVPGTDNIVVERRTAPGGDFADLGVLLPATDTTFTDAFAASSGTTYFYRVRVGNASGRSYSNEAYVTVPAPSSAPSGDGGGGCLSAAGPGTAGGAATDAASIGLLLLPVAAVATRKLVRHLRQRGPLRHPVC
jgi:hypothetical protein